MKERKEDEMCKDTGEATTFDVICFFVALFGLVLLSYLIISGIDGTPVAILMGVAIGRLLR